MKIQLDIIDYHRHHRHHDYIDIPNSKRKCNNVTSERSLVTVILLVPELMLMSGIKLAHENNKSTIPY